MMKFQKRLLCPICHRESPVRMEPGWVSDIERFYEDHIYKYSNEYVTFGGRHVVFIKMTNYSPSSKDEHPGGRRRISLFCDICDFQWDEMDPAYDRERGWGA